MNTTTIPSNFSVEEILRYTEIPSYLENKLLELQKQLQNQKLEIEILHKQNERISEQDYFKEVFIEKVLELCNETKKHKDLVLGIKLELENSYLEIDSKVSWLVQTSKQ